jgi:hypothetical protein
MFALGASLAGFGGVMGSKNLKAIAARGTMDIKIQDSNYFTSDDESAFIPYTAASDMWDTRYANVLVFEPVYPRFEAPAMTQVRAAIAKRQRYSPTDRRSITMFGREEFRPIMEGITIGLQVLLLTDSNIDLDRIHG